jgi:hypothetical protein
MLMTVMVDFDELAGYEIEGTAAVDRVVSHVVRLDNGDTYQFDEDVEYLVNEFDDVLILKSVYTLARLEESRNRALSLSFLPEEDRVRSLETNDNMAALVRRNGGELIFYKLVINDTIYDAELRP